MFLLFDLFWIALILVSFFDTNGADNPKEKPTTIQNNLAFAAFPSTNESKRYKFNEGRRILKIRGINLFSVLLN